VILTIGGKESNAVSMSVLKFALARHSVAPDSMDLVTECYGRLATTTTIGDGRNPPEVLGGTAVKIRDSAGVERPAPIQYVSPFLVRYVLPSGTAVGQATLTITSGSGVVSTGLLEVRPIVPRLFCWESGCDFPVAFLVRLRNSVQTTEPVVESLGPDVYRWLPIDMGPETDELHLVMFGTGLRFRSSLSRVIAKANPYVPERTMDVPVEYAGPQNEFAGLDQVNLKLPRSLAGSRVVSLEVTIDGESAIYTALGFK
jgi:uncharacterized protein (TIGR03437 family)